MGFLYELILYVWFKPTLYFWWFIVIPPFVSSSAISGTHGWIGMTCTYSMSNAFLGTMSQHHETNTTLSYSPVESVRDALFFTSIYREVLGVSSIYSLRLREVKPDRNHVTLATLLGL